MILDTVELKRDVLNYIRIDSKFSEHLRRVVREVPGREWVNRKGDSHWRVPIGSFQELITLFKQNHIEYIVDEETKQFLVDYLESRKKLEQLKKDEGQERLVEGMEFPLFPYQSIGVEFIKEGKYVLLADQMGLGKTVQAIATIQELQPKRTLIICMNSLKFNWKNEFKMHAPRLDVAVVQGDKRTRKAIWESKHKILIANHELLVFDEDIMPDTWDYIIADEISQWAKNHNAKRAKSLKRLKCNRRLGITGTPMENQLMELHSIMEWIYPGLLGSYWEFKARHIVTGSNGTFISYRNIPEIHAKVGPYMLRRLKDEVSKDLPPKTKTTIPIELTDEEKEYYIKWNKNVVEQIDPVISERVNIWTQNVLTKMLRLKQIVDHPAILEAGYEGTSSKFEALKDIVSETDEKVVVFTQFKSMADILSRHFKAMKIAGGVGAEERMDIIKKFTTNKDQVLVSTEAGAYGLTITAASVIVHYDLPWNPAKLLQREDRLHRISQKKPVTVYELVAQQTIDEYIVDVLFRKLQAFDLIIEQMNNPDAVNLEQRITRVDIDAMMNILPTRRN